MPGTDTGRAPERVDPLLGMVLDSRYHLDTLVARGAMGAVYVADQILLDRKVAVKVMDPQHLHESLDKFEERFRLEASTLARLQHPNIVRVYDYGRVHDRPYLVMEFIDGYSLQRLQSRGPIPPARAVHIATQMCDALEEAHSLDLIHRDLKPANVLLTRHAGKLDVVKVVDFGLAKDLVGVDPEVTEAGQVMGTPMYMAPEQIRDDACDGRTDIYALGMLMYRSLTGKLPFKAGQTTAVLLANLQQRPPPFGIINPNVTVPHELERVVLQCLEKDPDRRFANVRVLREALKRFEFTDDPMASGASGPVPTIQPAQATVEETNPRSMAVRRLIEELPPPPSPQARRVGPTPWYLKLPPAAIGGIVLIFVVLSMLLGAGIMAAAMKG